jgi:hypothetical protein
MDCDSPTPTPRPTITPSPTPTLTPEPTATPDYPLGVRLDMPEMIHPGETFYVTGFLDNPDPSRPEVATFFILEIFGDFWFWPSWIHFDASGSNQVDFEFIDVPTGTLAVTVLPEFPWPDTGPDTVTGLWMFGAMLTEDMTAILGNMASQQWGYGPQ